MSTVSLVTATYAGICGIILLVLSSRVVNLRREHEIGFGDGGNRELQKAIRVHANFGEYVPLALVLLLLVEMSGSDALIVHGLGGALVVGRILHAHGLSRSRGVSVGRFAGTLLTWMMIAVACSILLLQSLPR